MKIQVIDFGYKNLPARAHYNDAGADVFACFHDGREAQAIPAGCTEKIPLGLGVILPDGFMANVYPRSGLSSQGIVCELPPIDSGYRGEIHAIVHNGSNQNYIVRDGDKIGQLVMVPIILCDFVENIDEESRGSGAFGSTGN